ncbi:hypothetical protein PIB30_063559 [Stylosanthes scabra]|uniref:Uncharacterized protein n=1 Tax=Stylosanthes scabra TaxID=79078 RepID=A0ABU6VL84_9FABA|nr:hypothetical protein [Stylosanthes scabra]
MSGTGTPGGASRERQPTPEEQDQLNRSIKKVRKEDKDFTGTLSMIPREEDWMINNTEVLREQEKTKTFAQMVKEGQNRNQLEDDEMSDGESDEDEGEEDSTEDDEEEGGGEDIQKYPGIKIEKRKEGLYNITISKSKEKNYRKHGRKQS